ncbi:hypothetical protein SAMCCGM7_pA0356 (plasmid) [Sinorhizobium americanum CCGM7]|nr:hypothetical protein SAMCCGM7_pA0356 [Sinorhizobium americanum CCGM7]
MAAAGRLQKNGHPENRRLRIVLRTSIHIAVAMERIPL